MRTCERPRIGSFRKTRPPDIEAMIAYHQQRVARDLAKWKPPTLAQAIEAGRDAREDGPEAVIEAVCLLYRIRPSGIVRTRRQTDCDCRSAVVWVLREMRYSWPEIARHIGQPSHSSAISAWRRASEILNTEGR